MSTLCANFDGFDIANALSSLLVATKPDYAGTSAQSHTKHMRKGDFC